MGVRRLDLLVGVLLLCSAGIAAAQDPEGPWGHAGIPETARAWGRPAAPTNAGFVQLLGIEENWEEAVDPALPQTGGGHALQVQYPLSTDPAEQAEQYFATPQYPAYPPPTYPPPGYPQQPLPPPAMPEEPAPWIGLQQLAGEATWIVGGKQQDSLGIVGFDLRAKIEFPRAPMLTITPRAGWQLLDGPQVTDLPAQLYDGSIETVLSLPVRKNLFMQAAVSPSVFTDGKNTTADMYRFPARFLTFFSVTDHLTLSSGVVYLDRDNVKFLPSAGLIYKPNEDFKMELLIPRPKIAWRYTGDGITDSWVYIVGEFGGGSYAIRRASGVNDVATLTDYKAMLGWERLTTEGPALRFEGGYVFGRSVEYSSGIGDSDLAGTGVVRIGLTY